MDTIQAHVAVLDAKGFILNTNRAWNNFAIKNPLQDGSLPSNVGIGSNYLNICKTSAGPSAENSLVAYKGIKDVLDGKKRQFSLKYPCHSPTQQRWFMMQVNVLRGSKPRELVVVHTDITELILAEIEVHRKTTQLTTALEYLQTMAGQIKSSIALEKPAPSLEPTTKSSNLIKHAHQEESELLKRLSKREKDVLLALVRGERNTDIAARLNLSCKSVSTYRSRILEKLNAKSNAELVTFMARLGVIR